MLKKLNNQAFTLIEVVIVIAIGALIILVVLQAVSNAQQSQRDSTRRQEASQIASALETYAANNQGNYPSNINAVIGTDYVSQSIQDRWQVGTCGSIGANDYFVVYEALGNPARDYRLAVCVEQGQAEVDVRSN